MKAVHRMVGTECVTYTASSAVSAKDLNLLKEYTQGNVRTVSLLCQEHFLKSWPAFQLLMFSN